MHYFTANKKLIHYIITALLLFGVAYIPPIAPVTETGMGMLGVFLGCVYGWSTIGMLWTSLMAFPAMALAIGMQAVLGASFGNSIIMMVLVFTVIMQLLNETKAIEVLSIRLLTNKLTLGRPWLFMFIFFLAAMLCSIANPIVAVMLFIGFLRQICISVDIPLRSPFTAMFGIGLAIAALLGQSSLPFFSAGIQYFLTCKAMLQMDIPYAQWTILFFTTATVIFISIILISRFIFRLDVSNLKNLDPAIFGEKQKLTMDQIIPIITFVVFVLLMVISSVLPQGNILSRLTPFGIAAVLAGILMLMHKEDKPYFDFNAMAKDGISWDVIFLVAIIQPLAQFLCSESTGIAPALAMILNPFMSLPPLVFIIMCLLIGTLLTNVANNFVIALMIMPVIVTFAAQNGINPVGTVMALVVCTQIAVATPGASFPAGIAFSFSDVIEAKIMMKYGWICAVLLAIVTILFAWPVANLLF